MNKWQQYLVDKKNIENQNCDKLIKNEYYYHRKQKIKEKSCEKEKKKLDNNIHFYFDNFNYNYNIFSKKSG